MKKTIQLFLMMSVLTSCGDDFLDLAPPSNLNSSQFYKTQEDMNQAVLSAYGNLRLLYNVTFIRLGEIRSDNTTYSWLGGNPVSELGIDNFSNQLLPENTHPTSCWNNAYKVINHCNIVIGRIDQAEFQNETLRNQYQAEARFIRALMYFWLNRVFGGEAINGQLLGVIRADREITAAESYTMLRAPLKEIYDLIIEDLKYAEEHLPTAYGTTMKGRVTKAGATGLLGKVYITMAGHPMNGGNEYYQLAAAKLKEVIDNPAYSLVPSYKDLFDVTKKNSVESLFEIQYKKGSTGGATGSPWNNAFAPRFSNTEVVKIGDRGGENAPTQDLSDAYEHGDPRKYISMRDGWTNASNNVWEGDKYVCKYYDIATSASDNDNNWIELRLADIYLLYAESLVRISGNKSLAIDYINKIRQRARQTPGDPSIRPNGPLLKDYAISDFTNDNELLLAIEKERRIELAFENHRWFDLVRTKRAKEVMIAEQLADGYEPFSWQDESMIYPVPLTVMQSNPGKIIQNKGYTQQ